MEIISLQQKCKSDFCKKVFTKKKTERVDIKINRVLDPIK